MKTIEIFDPAMCCPTGLCGTNIDPNLMRIAVIVDTLKKKGINIIRHNLKDEPMIYVTNTKVNDLLQSKGVEVLPITLVDGEVAVTGEYPTTKQIADWSGINLDFMPIHEEKVKHDEKKDCCDSSDYCC
ncbi:MAG: arsenite efflux transporter metallochaperone ArsD [Muribaculaceae bacterium]|nr:arsenite efflux transporter metallochaperone ArsD [Muribaculaceae bacterium]